MEDNANIQQIVGAVIFCVALCLLILMQHIEYAWTRMSVRKVPRKHSRLYREVRVFFYYWDRYDRWRRAHPDPLGWDTN